MRKPTVFPSQPLPTRAACVLLASVSVSVGLLIPADASAAETSSPTARIALHPAEVLDGSAVEATQLQGLVAKMMRDAGADLIVPESTDVFLKSRSDGDCAVAVGEARVRCLAELARAVGAEKAVLVSIAPYAGENVIVSAQVVNPAGVVVQDVPAHASVRKAAGSSLVAVRNALGILMPQIDLTRPATAAAPVDHGTHSASGAAGPSTTSSGLDVSDVVAAPANPVAISPTPTPDRNTGASWRTIGGYAAIGTGVALVGGGVWGLADAQGKRRQLEELYSTRPPLTDRDRVAALSLGARQSQTLGFVAAGAGALGIAAGTWLLLSNNSADSRGSDSRSSWNWHVGPGFAAVSGTLP